jgi:hypothetical protein
LLRVLADFAKQGAIKVNAEKSRFSTQQDEIVGENPLGGDCFCSLLRAPRRCCAVVFGSMSSVTVDCWHKAWSKASKAGVGAQLRFIAPAELGEALRPVPEPLLSVVDGASVFSSGQCAPGSCSSPGARGGDEYAVSIRSLRLEVNPFDL